VNKRATILTPLVGRAAAILILPLGLWLRQLTGNRPGGFDNILALFIVAAFCIQNTQFLLMTMPLRHMKWFRLSDVGALDADQLAARRNRVAVMVLWVTPLTVLAVAILVEWLVERFMAEPKSGWIPLVEPCLAAAIIAATNLRWFALWVSSGRIGLSTDAVGVEGRP
jgi:hypothetical protein